MKTILDDLKALAEELIRRANASQSPGAILGYGYSGSELDAILSRCGEARVMYGSRFTGAFGSTYLDGDHRYLVIDLGETP